MALKAGESCLWSFNQHTASFLWSVTTSEDTEPIYHIYLNPSWGFFPPCSTERKKSLVLNSSTGLGQVTAVALTSCGLSWARAGAVTTVAAWPGYGAYTAEERAYSMCVGEAGKKTVCRQGEGCKGDRAVAGELLALLLPGWGQSLCVLCDLSQSCRIC